jgi:hypothetical protein
LCRLGRRWHAFVRAVPLLAAHVVILSVGQPVSLSVADEQKLIRFDIPQQSLASALESYSATTGVVGLYRAQLAVGRMSKPVAGHYAPEMALALMLNESGLKAQYASADAFTLVPARDGAQASRSVASVARAGIAQQDDVQRDYSALLQERISAALCASGATRPGDYRIALSFRVGSTGEIEQFNLLGSSGDRNRDDAIANALRTLAIGRQAPPHMSQPFTMVVLPPSSGGSITCPPIRSALRNG